MKIEIEFDKNASLSEVLEDATNQYTRTMKRYQDSVKRYDQINILLGKYAPQSQLSHILHEEADNIEKQWKL